MLGKNTSFYLPPLLPSAAMVAVVALSNVWAQEPYRINDYLLWASFTYPFVFAVTNLTRSSPSPSRPSRRAKKGFLSSPKRRRVVSFVLPLTKARNKPVSIFSARVSSSGVASCSSSEIFFSATGCASSLAGRTFVSLRTTTSPRWSWEEGL